MLVHLVAEMLMIYVSYTHNHDIISIIVISVISSHVVFIKVECIISVSFLWLSHHVLSVHVIVNIFNQSLLVSMMVVFMLLAHFFLHKFQFLAIEGTVADHISKKSYSIISITFEDSKSKLAFLSSSL